MVIFRIFLILLCTNYTFGQANNPTFKPLLDSVISKSKDLSYYTDLVDWDLLESEIYAAANNAKDINELKPAFEILLNGLTDHHGTIRLSSDYSILAHFTDYKNAHNTDKREFDPEIWSVVNNLDSRFEYTLLPHKIGYLKVVGIGPNIDGQKEAERIRNAVIELYDKKINKWIIDLRYNGGGNVNVMLSGLAPLLNDGVVASIKNNKNEIQGTAEIKKGAFWYYDYNAFQIKADREIQNPNIAILTSRWTASSGELTAIAFKGQTNTRFFGEKTGGYTTNNCMEIINDELILVISTDLFCDRIGNIYANYVKPDVEIEFEVTTDKEKDAGIISAIKWLNEK